VTKEKLILMEIYYTDQGCPGGRSLAHTDEKNINYLRKNIAL
jgi:hypothetical protein